MRYDDRQDHSRAKEFSKHAGAIAEVRKRAQQWRLTDCDEATLNRMRHSLLDELDDVEKRLHEADAHFLQCIEAGAPLAVEQAAQKLNRISTEWTSHNTHLQEIDDAILQRHLRTRLIRWFGSERRLNQWDSFVLFIIVVVLVITLIEFVWLSIDPEYVNQTFIVIDTTICFILLGDFGVRFYYSEDRWWYFRNYWVDFVSSIPLVGILRLGRFVRLARFARLLRLFRLGRAMRSLQNLLRGFDTLGQTLQIHLLQRSFLFGLVMLFVGAFAIYYTEPQLGVEPSAETTPSDLIVTEAERFGDSFWWSFTTVITGGFADIHDPVSEVGRLITGLLVLVGLVIVSIFTASLTSVLVDDSSKSSERKLFQMQQQMEVVAHRLDLLGNETNEGLLALETVAQQLSNQSSAEKIGQVLTQTMLDSFEAIQSSLHLYDPIHQTLERTVSGGLSRVEPAQQIAVGDGFVGSVSADILQQNLATFDVEPIDTPCIPVKGTSVACPLVAQGQFLGVLHLVLPSHLGRFYLYNRAPMTLSHHAAIAIHAAQLEALRVGA